MTKYYLSNDRNINLVAGMRRLLEVSNKLRISHWHLISPIYSFQPYLASSEHKFLTSEMLSLQSKKKVLPPNMYRKNCYAILEFRLLLFHGEYFGCVSLFCTHQDTKTPPKICACVLLVYTYIRRPYI